MQRQKIIILVIALVLALASVAMIKVYMDGQRKITEEELQKKIVNVKKMVEEDQVPILVAKDVIPEGTTITADMLDVKTVSSKQVTSALVTELDKAIGMNVAKQINKGEAITVAKITAVKREGAQDANTKLSGLTPTGKRAITVMVDSIAGLAGMIKPGDYVDVLSTLPLPVRSADGKQSTTPVTFPLFQNILVLAVGQETAATPIPLPKDSRYKKDTEVKESLAITLALNPQEANIIAFAQEQGKIRLILRSPTDVQVQPVAPASWDTVLQYVMPPDKNEEAKKNEPQVEIYRGLSKEQVPLGK